MRTIARSLALIETVAVEPGTGLDALARRAGLPRASCARLLAALDRLGWLAHQGRSGGWWLGPRAQEVGERAPYCSLLLGRARPAMEAAAAELGQPVGLSVLRGCHRLIVERVWPGRRRDLHLLDRQDEDLAATGPGRLLLAMQRPALRRALCRRLGLPDSRRWPGCVDTQELAADLARIARDRRLDSRKGGQAASAVALPDGLGGWAVLHTFAPRPGHPRAAAALAEAAAAIAAAGGRT